MGVNMGGGGDNPDISLHTFGNGNYNYLLLIFYPLKYLINYNISTTKLYGLFENINLQFAPISPNHY